MKKSKELTSCPFIIAPNLLTQNNFGIVIYDLDKETLIDCNNKYLELVDSPYREKSPYSVKPSKKHILKIRLKKYTNAFIE